MPKENLASQLHVYKSLAATCSLLFLEQPVIRMVTRLSNVITGSGLRTPPASERMPCRPDLTSPVNALSGPSRRTHGAPGKPADVTPHGVGGRDAEPGPDIPWTQSAKRISRPWVDQRQPGARAESARGNKSVVQFATGRKASAMMRIERRPIS